MTARMSGVWPPPVLSFTSAPLAINAETALSSPEVTALVNVIAELTRTTPSKLPEHRGFVRYLTVFGLKGWRYECLVESEPARKLCIRRSHTGSYPLIDRADRRQYLRPGQVTVSDSGGERLEQQILFTCCSIRFRVRRLIRNYQQRIDDR